ncbi:Lrp/AsnC family transcriptional regulator [Candidatus Woesearchaeota archaeon]|nr:Lrp/AsnC family transcriptional regulator [Candidatus Woesearchaeota archaeon]
MLSEKDLLILGHLRSNARKTLTSISKETGIPTSTVFDKIRAHEKNIIKKHTSIIDFPKLGYNIRTKIMVGSKNKENILKFLLASKYVNSLYQISGQFDLLADCIFRDMNELCSFLEELEEFDINKKEVHHVINEIKREEFLGV